MDISRWWNISVFGGMKKKNKMAQKMEAEKEREADHRRKMAENPDQFLPFFFRYA